MATVSPRKISLCALLYYTLSRCFYNIDFASMSRCWQLSAFNNTIGMLQLPRRSLRKMLPQAMKIDMYRQLYPDLQLFILCVPLFVVKCMDRYLTFIGYWIFGICSCNGNAAQRCTAPPATAKFWNTALKKLLSRLLITSIVHCAKVLFAGVFLQHSTYHSDLCKAGRAFVDKWYSFAAF